MGNGEGGITGHLQIATSLPTFIQGNQFYQTLPNSLKARCSWISTESDKPKAMEGTSDKGGGK